MTEQAMDGVAALERASALSDLDRWDDAASHLRKILATDPHNEEAFPRGWSDTLDLDPNEASSQLAVRLMVGAVPALRKEEAAAYRRTLALEPDNRRAHHELAALRLASGRDGNTGALAQAAGGFADVLRTNPRSSEGVFLLAVPALVVGRFVSVLAPELRGHLISVLRSPLNAGALLCHALAATALVVGAIFQGVNLIACCCALALVLLSRPILWLRNRSRFGARIPVRANLWRVLWRVVIPLVALYVAIIIAVLLRRR